MILISNSDDAASWLPGVTVVRDARPERGSLVGLHTALTHARSDVLVVAWDMPFVTSDLLGLIRSRAKGEPFATVPEGPRGAEPFCAVYTSSCLPTIRTALDEGDLRLWKILRRLPSVTRIPATDLTTVGDPGRLFFNVNDAQDLEIARGMAETG